MRGYGKAGVLEAVRAAGGEVYAITSEPHSLARNAQEDWETGMTHVGDPHQEIATTCRDRGWISLFRHQHADGFLQKRGSWVSHPGGYFQPGVLALTRTGRVLYRWRSRPERGNLGGAIARPTPVHVLRSVRAALDDPQASDVPLDDAPELDARRAPWPLFVALLFANGWFRRPVPFDQRADGTTPRQRIRRAAWRLAGFAAAWLVAAWLLPLWLVGLAFVAWGVAITPGLRLVHQTFQKVSPGEEPA